jgi:membrane protein insertase Oxa1/YidC/SpoIIIJ
MMTWMMPIMFGMFSFMYTASFSIYIIVSSVFSLTSNAVINLMVDRKFARLAAEEARKLELRRTGKLINGEEPTTKKKKK